MIDLTIPLKLAINDFGEEVILEDGSLPGQTLRGLFDNDPTSPEMFAVGVESTGPMLTLLVADVPDDLICHGTALRVADDDYKVTGIAKNKGELRLTLRKRWDHE
jgi:hypothetical protein